MLKKSLLVLGLSVGLVSNMFGNEPVRVKRNLSEDLEDIVLVVSEVVLEEVEEEFDFEFLYPTLEVSEVVLEEVEEEEFVFLFETLGLEDTNLLEVEEKYQEKYNL